MKSGECARRSDAGADLTAGLCVDGALVLLGKRASSDESLDGRRPALGPTLAQRRHPAAGLRVQRAKTVSGGQLRTHTSKKSYVEKHRVANRRSPQFDADFYSAASDCLASSSPTRPHIGDPRCTRIAKSVPGARSIRNKADTGPEGGIPQIAPAEHALGTAHDRALFAAEQTQRLAVTSAFSTRCRRAAD